MPRARLRPFFRRIRIRASPPQLCCSAGHNVVVPGDHIPFDSYDYERRVRGPGCFICRIVAGEHDLPTHVVHRDERHIAFLAGFPRQPVLEGYVLVAPLEHREGVVDDFTNQEYLDLQAVIYKVGRAIASVVPTERLYVLSLGSRQGNSHVHWHVAPLPPGIPFEQQQYRALMPEFAGLLPIDEDRMAALASAIAARLEKL